MVRKKSKPLFPERLSAYEPYYRHRIDGKREGVILYFAGKILNKGQQLESA
jgi:hypothetical protein